MSGIDPLAYEGDIVSRLRHWRGLHLAHGGMLFEEAADEIERLRALQWKPIADGAPPISRVLVTREVNGQKYVDVVNWITEPDSGLPRLNPSLSQVTHWMDLPEPAGRRPNHP